MTDIHAELFFRILILAALSYTLYMGIRRLPKTLGYIFTAVTALIVVATIIVAFERPDLLIEFNETLTSIMKMGGEQK